MCSIIYKNLNKNKLTNKNDIDLKNYRTEKF